MDEIVYGFMCVQNNVTGVFLVLSLLILQSVFFYLVHLYIFLL